MTSERREPNETSRGRRPAAAVAALLVAATVLLGCAAKPDQGTPSAPGPTSPGAEPSASLDVETSEAPSTSEEPSAPAASDAPGAAVGLALALTPTVTGLDAPLDVATRPGDETAVYVVEQAGRIRVVRGGTLLAEPLLDIRDKVTSGGEQGLLGLAFHPTPDDGRFFVYYTDRDGAQVVASYRTADGAPDRALPDSETVLLRMADRFPNHNGGSLAFGPDGYLYIGTGDGGGAGDPLGSGQDRHTLLGKILRIDVDGTSPDGSAYRIPDDNPFIGADGLPEIFATGLRNPWRFRFDRLTGDLWIGDVGQASWEEIDRIPAGDGGQDFGWNIREGTHCYQSGPNGCDPPGLTGPVTEYGHDEGCSVTGGTVYRGDAQPDLSGRYVFADYCSGRFWTIDAAGAADGFQAPVVALDSGRHISAVAEDGSGELVATDISRGELLGISVGQD